MLKLNGHLYPAQYVLRNPQENQSLLGLRERERLSLNDTHPYVK